MRRRGDVASRSSVGASERGGGGVLTERHTGDVAASRAASRSSRRPRLRRRLALVQHGRQQGGGTCGDRQSTSQGHLKVAARTQRRPSASPRVRPTAVVDIHHQGESESHNDFI